VCFTGPGVSGRGSIALEHLARPPASDPHEVRLQPTLSEPGMGERVAQLVRMQALDAGLATTAPEHLCQAGGGEGSLLPEPSHGDAAWACLALTRR
jgi:hypothetical protein